MKASRLHLHSSRKVRISSAHRRTINPPTKFKLKSDRTIFCLCLHVYYFGQVPIYTLCSVKFHQTYPRATIQFNEIRVLQTTILLTSHFIRLIIWWRCKKSSFARVYIFLLNFTIKIHFFQSSEISFIYDPGGNQWACVAGLWSTQLRKI